MEYLTGILLSFVFTILPVFLLTQRLIDNFGIFLYMFYGYVTVYILMVISGLHRETKLDILLGEIEDLKKSLEKYEKQNEENGDLKQ